MVGKRLRHPAFDGLKIGQEFNVKDRRPTVEQNKEKQRIKKLNKKRRKGR